MTNLTVYPRVTKTQTLQDVLQDLAKQCIILARRLARILQERHWPCKNLARQTLTLQESCKEDNELARKTLNLQEFAGKCHRTRFSRVWYNRGMMPEWKFSDKIFQSSDVTFQSCDITFSKFGYNVFKVRMWRFQSSDVRFSKFNLFVSCSSHKV